MPRQFPEEDETMQPTNAHHHRRVTFAKATNVVLVLAGIHASGCASDAEEAAVERSATPLTSQSYEAEAAGNTRTGLATASACAACSGGARVGWIGSGSEGSGLLRFEGVRVDSDD